MLTDYITPALVLGVGAFLWRVLSTQSRDIADLRRDLGQRIDKINDLFKPTSRQADKPRSRKKVFEDWLLHEENLRLIEGRTSKGVQRILKQRGIMDIDRDKVRALLAGSGMFVFRPGPSGQQWERQKKGVWRLKPDFR